MLVKHVPYSWVVDEEHRLDCGPFTRGGIESKKILERWQDRKQRLSELTQNGLSGIYHVGMDKLRWVHSPAYGVPFLRSAGILKADLSSHPFISKDQVDRNPLFRCPEGTTLITRSGTIGQMAYCRSDMAGMAMSQDILKVVPNSTRVPSGYLHAFLSSKFGIPLIVSGTFGSIIVHIEAENIAALPVPRLGNDVEGKAHDLVECAALKRTKAADLLAQATKLLISNLGLSRVKSDAKYPRPQASIVRSGLVQSRMDAFYYSKICRDARSVFDDANCELRPLSEVAEVFIPGIFKRRYADDPRHGYPYITGGDVFQLAPTSDKYLMTSVAEQYQLVLKVGMILIQEAGQLGGLIGRSVQVGHYLDGFACTNNMVRVTPSDESDAGYLYSVLASPYGVRLISREAAGSSIPHIEVSRVQNLMIPWADEVTRRRIGEPAIHARQLRDEACTDENTARSLVEQSIEKAAL